MVPSPTLAGAPPGQPSTSSPKIGWPSGRTATWKRGSPSLRVDRISSRRPSSGVSLRDAGIADLEAQRTRRSTPAGRRERDEAGGERAADEHEGKDSEASRHGAGV